MYQILENVENVIYYFLLIEEILFDLQVMRKCVITPDFERRETAPPMHVSHNAKRKQKKVFFAIVVLKPFYLLADSYYRKQLTQGQKYMILYA